MTTATSSNASNGCTYACALPTPETHARALEKRRGNSVFPIRISKSLSTLAPIVERQKPPAGVHVAVATYLCTLRGFDFLKFYAACEGGLL